MFKHNLFGGNLADTSFDESNAAQPKKFDTSIADEVIKYRQKVVNVLESPEAITVRELKTLDDLTPYREWIIKLVKQTDKLQQTVDSDFVQQFAALSESQNELHEVLMRNEELERKVEKLNKRRGHGGGGAAQEYASDNSRTHDPNSYDD